MSADGTDSIDNNVSLDHLTRRRRHWSIYFAGVATKETSFHNRRRNEAFSEARQKAELQMLYCYTLHRTLRRGLPRRNAVYPMSTK